MTVDAGLVACRPELLFGRIDAFDPREQQCLAITTAHDQAVAITKAD